MKIVLAPDSFKESMTAKEACLAMEKGIKRVINEIEIVHAPMGDGGEGTLDALVDATNGEIYYKDVVAPLGNKVRARFGILGDKKTAIIEMAEASGLHLVDKDNRNPLITTSFGTGELIKEALDKDVDRILIGLGGSATNDAGVGMLQALGVRFKDKENNEVSYGGGELRKISSIDISNLDKRILSTKIEIACDVKNPLTGPEGASEVFGRQKGANDEIVKILDENLKHFANISRKIIGKDIDNIQGAGAAGGLGAALIGFCNGEVKPGIDTVIEYSRLEDKLKGADFVFTGEGSIDFQTKFGKTPVGVATLAKKYNTPVIAFAGKIGKEINELYSLGIDSIVGITPGTMELDKALKEGKNNLAVATENIVRIIAIKHSIL
ncbi:glycerate kinase [Clostridium sp.]|uniref:glycerate kinase n=1 Tax=Clostridium sp. TaxID=1506 RepID=UPI001D8E8812|nr:glycerate kinase [Clostridium sp.]MBS5938177.1 glycerate kinase [Clostridium sp.]